MLWIKKSGIAEGLKIWVGELYVVGIICLPPLRNKHKIWSWFEKKTTFSVVDQIKMAKNIRAIIDLKNRFGCHTSWACLWFLVSSHPHHQSARISNPWFDVFVNFHGGFLTLEQQWSQTIYEVFSPFSGFTDFLVNLKKTCFMYLFIGKWLCYYLTFFLQNYESVYFQSGSQPFNVWAAIWFYKTKFLSNPNRGWHSEKNLDLLP